MPLHIVILIGQKTSEAPAAAQTAPPSQPSVPQESVQHTPSPEPPSESGFLPAGWEVRSAPSGRPFFIDHNSKTTTWVRRRQTSHVLLPPCGDHLLRNAFSLMATRVWLHEGQYFFSTTRKGLSILFLECVKVAT